MDFIILGRGGTGRELASLLKQEDHQVKYLDDVQVNSEIIGKCSDYSRFVNEGMKLCSAIAAIRKCPPELKCWKKSISIILLLSRTRVLSFMRQQKLEKPL